MTVRTVYRCDCCGQDYSSEVECKNCELAHAKPTEIIKTHLPYRSPYESDMWKYPLRIRVRMDDDKIISYYYERIHQRLELETEEKAEKTVEAEKP